MYPFFSVTYKAISQSRAVSSYDVEFDGHQMDFGTKIGNAYRDDYGTIYNSYLAEKDGYELVKMLVNEDTSISVWDIMTNII